MHALRKDICLQLDTLALRERRFSVTNLKLENFCQCFDSMVFIRMNKKQLIAMQCERSARIVSSKALIHVWKLSLVNQVGPSVVYAPPLYTSHNQIKTFARMGNAAATACV